MWRAVFFRFRKGNPSIQAMQLDLRNDMVSNVASLFSGLVASGIIHRRFFDVDLKYVDPGVAILIALYIAISWGRQLISAPPALPAPSPRSHFTLAILTIHLRTSIMYEHVLPIARTCSYASLVT